MLSYQKNEVLSELQKKQSFLLLCHHSPDGDTLGSALALGLRLKRLGSEVQILIPSEVPDRLRFLPGLDFLPVYQGKPEAFEIAVGVDVSSKEMMKANQVFFDQAALTMVIDHHKTNPCYGKYNMVDEEAPATAVLIYRLLSEMPGELSLEESICLYTGLSTDTGNFIYESTNAETFAMMEALMKAGLPIGTYARLLFRQLEEPFVRLLKEALNTLKISGDGRIAGMSISLDQMKKAGANEGNRDTIVNYAIDMKEVCLGYLASEMPNGSTKISLRSKYPYDVGSLAQSLGGGGHAQAAGVTLKLPMEQAVLEIESKLKMLLQDVKI